MEEMLSIILKVVGSIVGLFAAYAIKAGIRYLKERMTQQQAQRLDMLINSFVKGAEQLHKAEDPSGSIRLGYVQQMLIEAGYELTDAVRALIESKVYQLNQEAK